MPIPAAPTKPRVVKDRFTFSTANKLAQQMREVMV